MYFNFALIIVIVILIGLSFYKIFEIVKDLNNWNSNLEILRNKLFSETKTQISLKSKIELLDDINSILLNRIKYIIVELMEVQKSILSHN